MAELGDMFSRLKQRRDRRRAGLGGNFLGADGGPDPGMRGQINPLDSQAMMDRAQGVDIADVNPPTNLLSRRAPQADDAESPAPSPFRTAQYSGDEEGNGDVPVEEMQCRNGVCRPVQRATVTYPTTATVQAPTSAPATPAQPSPEQQTLAAIMESKGLPLDPKGQLEYHNAQTKAWAPQTFSTHAPTRNVALTQFRIHQQAAIDAAAMAQAAADAAAKMQQLQAISQNEAKFYENQRKVMEIWLPEPRRQMEIRMMQDPNLSPMDIARTIQMQRDAARKEAGTQLTAAQRKDEMYELAGAAAGFRFSRSAGIALAAKKAGQGGAAGQFGQDAWNTIRSHYGGMWNETGNDPIDAMHRDLMKPLTEAYLLHNTSRDDRGSPQHQLDAANEAAVTIEAYHRLLGDWKQSSQGATGRAMGLQAPARVMLPQSAPRSNSPLDYGGYGVE